MISGFMIVRNVLEQGYPFVEAIASALPICDEFLISDGLSTDGTYEVVKRIASLNPKIKLFQCKWPDKKDLTVLSDVTNEVRSKCRFEYIFSVQANEVIHEQSAPFIKALPAMLPTIETFNFPYMQMLNEYKFTEEFRLRFAMNLPRIVSVEDAWTLGISKDFIRSKKLRALANPRRLFGHVSNGIWYVYGNSCLGKFGRAIYLPKPIFRYWSLFPKSFLEKYERHMNLFHLPALGKSSDMLQLHINDPEAFWKMASEALKQTRFKESLQYPEAYASVIKQDHPAIIQEFISNPNVDHYYVREEMFELIGKL